LEQQGPPSPFLDTAEQDTIIDIFNQTRTRMIAYISSSIADNEQSTVSLLGMKLKKDGFLPKAGSHKEGRVRDPKAFNDIKKADLFIGLITCFGKEDKRVLAEWKQAIKNNIPAWLMVENVVDLADFPNLMKNPHVVQFNRTNPSKAIHWIQDQIRQSKMPRVRKAAWRLGGEATISLINHLATTA